MMDEDSKIAEVLKKCADVHLPDNFVDRLVTYIRESKKCEKKTRVKSSVVKAALTRLVLVAASLTLLLGFVPRVLDRSPDQQTQAIVHCDEIHSANPMLPQDGQLNALAFLGFCREVIRRRVRSLFIRSRKREEEE